jgi:hypothetical protein
MSTSVEMPLSGIRVKFDGGFQSDCRAHHLTRRDVERALRWPRWVDELTAAEGSTCSETVSVWVANPPMSSSRDPSSVLVVTRDQRGARWIHDAWRLYHSDLDLRHARTGCDVFATFLARYGLEVRIGDASRRLFLPCRLPMGRSANASPQVLGALARPETRGLQILRLVPERAEIEVAIAFAVDEGAVRADLARHRSSP